MPLKQARARRSLPTFEGCTGDLSIVAKNRDGSWSLELWWNHAHVEEVTKRRGGRRVWRKLSGALEFAALRYPQVSSFQLLWQASLRRAKTPFMQPGMADTSSSIAAPN